MTTTRRRFLKQSLGFSAALALYGSGDAAASLAAPPHAPSLKRGDGDRPSLHLLAIGDYGVKKKDLPRQRAVSDGMARYARRQGFRPGALLLLGDNFYGGLGGKGIDSPRWAHNVEAMYPSDAFPCPLYAVLGNHDYNDERGGKSVAAQLAYGRGVADCRWTLPNKWYAFDLAGGGNGDVDGGSGPLARVLVIDTNYVYRDKGWVTDKERKRQLQWLADELGRPRRAPWLFVLGHHPVYSNGTHGDTEALVNQVNPLLRRHKVDLYLCGHDHDLQHLEFKGHPTSFVVSGAGGARSREPKSSKRGPFARAVYGFTHLELSPRRFTVRHVDANGVQLHAFTKATTGRVTVG